MCCWHLASPATSSHSAASAELEVFAWQGAKSRRAPALREGWDLGESFPVGVFWLITVRVVPSLSPPELKRSIPQRSLQCGSGRGQNCAYPHPLRFCAGLCGPNCCSKMTPCSCWMWQLFVWDGAAGGTGLVTKALLTSPLWVLKILQTSWRQKPHFLGYFSISFPLLILLFLLLSTVCTPIQPEGRGGPCQVSAGGSVELPARSGPSWGEVGDAALGDW